MTDPKKVSTFKKFLKNPLFWIIFLLLLYSIIGFFIVPAVAKNQIIDAIKENLDREAAIESISFNPFTFSAEINEFELKDKDSQTFLSFSKLYTDLNIFPLFGGDLDIEELIIAQPVINIKKLTKERFNFSDLQKATESPQEEIDTLGAASDSDILIRRLDILKGIVDFKDFSTYPNANLRIENIDFLVSWLHPFSADTANISLNMDFFEGGEFELNGFVIPEPLSSIINYNLTDLNVKPAQPYVSEQAHLRIDSFFIGSEGRIFYSVDSNSALSNIEYSGTAHIHDVRLYDTKNDEKFLEWDSLNTRSISFKSSPLSFGIGEIHLKALFTRIAIAEDQSFNMVDILKEPPVAESADSGGVRSGQDSAKIDFAFKIGRIKIEDSEMYFSDLSLPLQFAARIHDLNGEILGLESGNPLGASIKSEGTVDQYGLAKIEGNIDPFDPIAFTDIEMNFKNIELTNLSPYSVKFLGYMVDKGKLSLDLEYLIKNGQLTSYNKILLNQLTLGDEIEGAEGIGLPIKLAIALLKDSNGDIDLDLDVEGDLNDPEVDTGKLVWWALKRTLTTIVTAPFRFLGGLLGFDGEDMEFVDFEPGDAGLKPHQIEKLDNLTKAMTERPGLILKIYSAVDSVTDKRALQTLKAREDFTRRIIESPEIDTLLDPRSVEFETGRDVLETMFREAYSDSALNALVETNKKGSELDLRSYFDSLIETLIDAQDVTQLELFELAGYRSDAIKNYLTASNTIIPERIRIEETEVYEAEDRNWIKCRLGLDAE